TASSPSTSRRTRMPCSVRFRSWSSSSGTSLPPCRGDPVGWALAALAAGGQHGPQHRLGREQGSGQGAAADGEVDRYSALLGPVDVLEVEQQGKLIHD